MITRTLHTISAAVLFAVLLPGVVSCGKQGTDEKPEAPEIIIVSNPAARTSDSQFLVVNAEGDWNISLVFQGDQSGWARIPQDQKSGTGYRRNVLLDWDENTEETPRSVLLTISGKGGSSNALFTQKGTKDSRAANSGVKSTRLGWMELPETYETDSYDFFTRDMTYSNRTVRNYSYYWDYNYLVARWVAYPMIGGYKGSFKRNDVWRIDPMLTRDQQPVVVFRGFGSAGCDRGHQIPAADRTFSQSALDDTFFGTNQTPQYGSFNQGIWVGVENLVRSWAMKSDTLYVVTGCTPDGTRNFASDNDGKDIAIPTAYWKAVLSLSAGTYSGCAIYLPHLSTYPSSGNDIKSYSKSIRQLEAILGYNLFVNLPGAVGVAKANEIEEKDPSTSNWWWSN